MLLSTFIEFKNHFGPLIVIYWIWKSLRTITKLVMNTHTCENVHRTVYWHHANSIEMCIQYFKKILSFILSCVLSFVLNTHLSIFITVSGDQLRWFRNGSSRSTTRRNRRFLRYCCCHYYFCCCCFPTILLLLVLLLVLLLLLLLLLLLIFLLLLFLIATTDTLITK